MAKFFSRTVLPETQAAESGDRMHTTYLEKVDPVTGHKYIEPNGKTNVYARIQASLEDSKIENILRRAQAGDETALQEAVGHYIDATALPGSFGEMQSQIARAKSVFERLPLEVREKFDFSPEKYIARFGEPDWLEALGIKPEPEPEPEPEPKPTPRKRSRKKEVTDDES